VLAEQLGATRLVVLTDVPALVRGYGTDDQKEIGGLTSAEAEALLPELAEGSMRPKVEACVRFVRSSGGEALITAAPVLAGALRGESGTRIADE
jgi:carbamate kinase